MTKQTSLLLVSLFSISCIAEAQNNYNEISLVDLMKKKQQGDKNMVIVDVRTVGEYGDSSRSKSGNIGRIKDAINITVQDLEAKPEAVKQLDAYRDKDIYLICSHSYRSRTASNILLKNGFTRVNNVTGGMTEWYRRYDELVSYRDQLFDKDITYTNLSPSQLLTDLLNGKNILLLGIRNTPRFWWDSANIKLFQYYPVPKNTVYFNYADSLKVLEEVLKDKSRPVVLFNMVNSGAGELADWLTKKGIHNVSYLVGGPTLFYEYVSNKQMPAKTEALFVTQTNVRFVTPVGYCKMTGDKKVQLIDIRHDSLFKKMNDGVKHDYKHLKSAVNYFSRNGADQFEKEFGDKKKEYVFINSFSSEGMELADALTKKGYKVTWLIGGYDRWEWYMNNVEDFGCNDSLVK